MSNEAQNPRLVTLPAGDLVRSLKSLIHQLDSDIFMKTAITNKLGPIHRTEAPFPDRVEDLIATTGNRCCRHQFTTATAPNPSPRTVLEAAPMVSALVVERELAQSSLLVQSSKFFRVA